MSPLRATESSLPVLISGYYGFDNVGDEAILQAILQWFEGREDVYPVVMSGNPAETRRMYDVEVVHRARVVEILRKLFQCPVLLQGGGGLLQDSTSFRSLAYYLGILLLGFITGRRVVVFGQGIGPLDGELSPLLVGEFLSQCDLVCVRDFKSYAFCQARLPLDAPLKLMADAALLLKPSDAEKVEEIFYTENLDLLGKPLLGFAVKGSLKDKRQIVSLARVIDIVHSSIGGGVVLFPFHFPHDLEYAEAVRGMVSDKERVGILKGKYLPDEVLGLVGRCEMMVGMRLHSLIFASLQAVPFVAVSYDPKVDEYAGEFGLKPSVHTPLVGAEGLSESIEEAWENRARLKVRLIEGIGKLQRRAREGFEALGKFLDELELKKIARKRRRGREVS